MNEAQRYRVINEPIDVQMVIDQVSHRNAGAINTFIGTVREMTAGKQTTYLKYEAYTSMAVKQLQKIASEINEQWPEAETAIVHRTGELDIQDIAVVIAVATPHRADAFEACRYAIERIKVIVPIWKKEHWDDGATWLGDQEETMSYANNDGGEEV